MHSFHALEYEVVAAVRAAVRACDCAPSPGKGVLGVHFMLCSKYGSKFSNGL